MNIVEFKFQDDNNNIIYKKFLELKEFEINGLDYEEAIKLDKRSFFEFFP